MLDYVVVTPHDNSEKLIDNMGVLNIEYYYTSYLCHFFDCNFFDDFTEELSVDDAIQFLAIKDGVDFVQFDNGNYGFVAHYNSSVNGFEIIG